MKKATLLLVLLFISTLGFSQTNDDPIHGIDAILKRGVQDNNSQKKQGDPNANKYDLVTDLYQIINTENNPLIDQINKLELEYLNLKAKQVQYGFANQNLSELKTKDEVFEAYVAYLKKEISGTKPGYTTRRRVEVLKSNSKKIDKKDTIKNIEKIEKQ